MQGQADGHGGKSRDPHILRLPGPTCRTGSDGPSPSQRLGFLPAPKRSLSHARLPPHGLQPARLL